MMRKVMRKTMRKMACTFGSAIKILKLYLTYVATQIYNSFQWQNDERTVKLTN